MHKILLFVEDYGHETFIRALVERIAKDQQKEVKIINRNVRGGHGKVISEFKTYLRDLKRKMEAMPDLLIVATDANCKGFAERKREIDEVDDSFRDLIICAIPDPHIERWLLLDSAAFKSVLGKGCKAPDQKCERDRYKKLLLEAVLAAGVVPLLGGMEYAEDIVNAMDLTLRVTGDTSLDRFLKELHKKLRQWTIS